MTLTERLRPDSAVGRRSAGASATGARTTWIVVGVLAAAAIAGSIYVAQTGMSADPTRYNPAGKVVREDPLFGIDNWPAIFSSIFVVVSLAIGVVFARLSWRQRSIHHGLTVFLCVAGLSLLDPPANWVTFTAFDPQFLHYPSTWHWMSLAPTVEPIVNPPGYPMYFLTVAFCGAWAAKRVLARAKAGSWAARHPRGTYLGVGFLVGLVWDIPTELFMIRAHMYHYSEAWGPTIGIGHGRFPIVWGFFTWFAIATVTVLLHRDDKGRSLAHDWAAKLPGRGGITSPRVVLAGTLFLMVLYCIPMGMYAVIRVTGLSHPNESGWHYPEAKVYDPYGRLEDAGFPGPYSK